MLILTSTAGPSQPAAAQQGKILKQLTQVVANPGVGWSFRARVTGAVKQSEPRGTVLMIQFHDAQGAVLDAPHLTLTYSEALKSRFIYVPVEPSSGTGISIKPLLPPVGTVGIKCQVQLWHGPEHIDLDTELSLEPHEYALADIAAIERSNPQNAERVAWRSLEVHGNERQHLLEIQALAWRIGAPRLLTRACQLLEAAPEVRGYMRNQSRYALAALNELESGLASPGPAASSYKGLPHRIAHLAPAFAGETLALARMQSDQGMRPLILIPSEYAPQAGESGPYSVRQEEGTEIVAFSALGPQACRGVPRPDLLRFDVMLAEPWLRRARIGLLHAHVGRSGYDLALRALALGSRFRLPVVMNWHSPDDPHPVADATSPPPASEWAELGLRQQLCCAARADAVIVADPWQAWQLHRAGLPQDRVFVVPRLAALPPAPLGLPPTHGKKPWTMLVDVRGVPMERVARLASALPAAIGRKGVQLQLAGDHAATTLVENALRDAGMLNHLDTAPIQSDRPATVLVRLQPRFRPDQRDWLADLPDVACAGTLMLAESTPQSDYLVRRAGLGLTFNLDAPATLADALAALSPSRPDANRLRRNLHALAAVQTDAETLAGVIDRVYHHARCAIG